MLQRDRRESSFASPSTGAVSEANGRLPDFMIIGAAKCGTTTLHEWLSRNPDIFMTDPKEPEFFSKDEIYERGLEYYCSLFAAAKPHQICGEGSTTYTRWPHTADASTRIADLLPRTRFIYLMRNPVDRAYSHYAHHMRLGVTMTFEEALRRSSEYLDCGMYFEQVRRYLRFYPASQFLFLFLEDIKKDPQRIMAEVHRFLGVRDIAHRPEILRPSNESGPDYYIRRHTTWRLRAFPAMSSLADRVPRPLRDGFYRLIKSSPLGSKLQKEYVLPRMLPETRRRLVEIYREPNRELGEFLARDLSLWNK
jgi:hypothetical protein